MTTLIDETATSRMMRRGIKDFALAGAGFMMMVALFSAGDSLAFPGSERAEVLARDGRLAALILLGLMFSSMIAVSLGLWRHVRQIHLRQRPRRLG